MAYTGKENSITSYRWNSTSLITRIDVREQGKGESVAYIHAAPDDDSRVAELHGLRELFKQKGWVTSSDFRNDKPVLRLAGFGNARELISLLEEQQKQKKLSYIAGEPLATEIVPEPPKPKGLWATIRAHASRIAGVFYTAGNAAYVWSGISRGKDWGQMGTGIAFSSGDLLLAAVGGKDDKRQFKILLKGLEAHWKKEGIEIPQDAAIRLETRPKKSFWAQTYDFLHEHINKFKAAAEVLGGVFYFKAGYGQHNKGEPQGKWKMATAVIFSLGFGSTLFIEEKKPDKEKLKNAGWWEKLKAFVHERPLRVGGWSGLSNTLFTTIGALQERSAQQKIAAAGGTATTHYQKDLAAAGLMFFGNNAYALSNVSVGGSIDRGSIQEDVYGIVAQVLNRLPEDKREEAIQKTVDYLGKRTQMQDDRQEVDKHLRRELHRLTHDNPWFKASTMEPPAPAAPTAGANLLAAGPRNPMDRVTVPASTKTAGITAESNELPLGLGA